MQTPCRDTLLIVDDSELNRAILREIFYREYRIEEAENGRRALEVVARQQGGEGRPLRPLAQGGDQFGGGLRQFGKPRCV